MKENTIFTQLMKLIAPTHRESIFNKHQNNRYVKKFSGWQHFVVLFVAQVKGLRSLRDIVTTLGTHSNKHYHMGLKSLSRSTLSDANNKRSADAFRGLFQHLLQQCHAIAPKHRFRFKKSFYSMDSSTISLCLSVFPWAKFRSKKGGIKLHTTLNHSGYIPEFMQITSASKHDSTQSRVLCSKLPKGSIVAFDKGYYDFSWYYQLTLQEVFFVTRAKKNLRYKTIQRNPKDRKKGILFDHIIELTGNKQKCDYPQVLRLIKYRSPDDGKEYVYLTNHFKLSASTIAECYKERWQIELFFKWIKQNLKIKTFYGTTENAVLIQIWTALIYYLLVAFIRFMNKCKHTMLKITRLIKEQLFSDIWLDDLLNPKPNQKGPDLQLSIFLTGQ